MTSNHRSRSHIWTNDAPVNWCIYASFSLNDLMTYITNYMKLHSKFPQLHTETLSIKFMNIIYVFVDECMARNWEDTFHFPGEPQFNKARPREQGSWGRHWAHLGLTGPRWAPCWPCKPCYQEQCFCLLWWIYVYKIRTEFGFHICDSWRVKRTIKKNMIWWLQ